MAEEISMRARLDAAIEALERAKELVLDAINKIESESKGDDNA